MKLSKERNEAGETDLLRWQSTHCFACQPPVLPVNPPLCPPARVVSECLPTFAVVVCRRCRLPASSSALTACVGPRGSQGWFAGSWRRRLARGGWGGEGG